MDRVMQEIDSSEKISIGGDPNRDIGKDGREMRKCIEWMPMERNIVR